MTNRTLYCSFISYKLSLDDDSDDDVAVMHARASAMRHKMVLALARYLVSKKLVNTDLSSQLPSDDFAHMSDAEDVTATDGAGGAGAGGA